ncbi:MAG: energy-coupling factor transporter ATPase [Clostridiales bacterium]|nr:energy-coupling factor transporter ATPase [Clostridiales bacterium]
MSIEINNLRYVYNPGMPGETVALNDVSLTIGDGEMVGIIGHTGSGKSTLLQHMNGLLKPASGDVFVDGQCITDGKANLVDIRRKVGLVFQYPEYQLFEETVAKDVAFGPRNLGIEGEELDKTIQEAIEIVGLNYNEIQNSSPFELSGGMKRRVAIAGVIAMRPSVLILDEPTAGLDPTAHREILSMIRRINDNREIIIIFVSHNMDDIANMCSRVVVMDKGKVSLEGTPQEVFAQGRLLESMGLDVPPVVHIMNKISDEVSGFYSSALTIDEAAKDIREYIKRKK